MKKIHLGDSLEVLIDHRGKTPKKLGSEFVEQGIPVASAILVRDGVLDLSVARFVSKDTYEKWMTNPLRKGDVILTSEAPLGRVARVTSDSPIVLGQRLYGLRGKPGILDSGFLYYALKTKRIQTDLLGRSTGTTVFGIRQSALRDVEILTPSYGEQQAIAEVLGSLDDKIAGNNKFARTVDEYLSALFASLAEDSPVEVALSDIADVNAITIKTPREGHLRYIDIASVNVGWHGTPELTNWSDAPSRARRRVRMGDTIWSTVRPNLRSHSLNLADDPLLVASTGLAVLSPRTVGFAYLYELSKRPEFTAYLENVAEGSAYPAVRADRFQIAPVPLLPRERRQDFEDIAAPLRQHVHSLAVENNTLTAIRDALLPHLISGQLRLREITTNE